jgi:tripartite motif-containing protein 71
LYGTADGQFRYPQGVAVAAKGNVFVADSANARVQYFTPTGSFLGKWGSFGTGPGEFHSPTDVTLLEGGKRIYVLDAGYNCRIQFFE